MITLIDAGYRLAPPPGCPRNLYSVMIMCWYLPEKIIIELLRIMKGTVPNPQRALATCIRRGLIVLGALLKFYSSRTGCDSHDKRFVHAHYEIIMHET